MSCVVCLAAETADDDSKERLIRIQAVTIERLRSNLDTFKLTAAQMRIRELEESLDRVNRSQPMKAAVDVAADLAEIDPRSNDTLLCHFCFQGESNHRKDCIWRRAVTVASEHKRMQRRQAS